VAERAGRARREAPAHQAVQAKEAAEVEGAEGAAVEAQAREAVSVRAARREPEAFPARAVPLEPPGERVPEEPPGAAERPAREQQGCLGRVERREREPQGQPEQQGPGECPAQGEMAVAAAQRGRLQRPALAAHRPRGPEQRQVRAGPRGLRALVQAVDSSKISAALAERVQGT
jgi:hypothetical protein